MPAAIQTTVLDTLKSAQDSNTGRLQVDINIVIPTSVTAVQTTVLDALKSAQDATTGHLTADVTFV